MGAAYRSSNYVAYGTRTNATVTAPAGVQNGDVILLFFLIGAGTPPTPTPPSGFTALSGFPVTVSSGGFSVKNYCWYKVANGEPGSYTVSHSSASSEAYVVAVSGGGTGSAPAATTNSGTKTTTTALSITTAAANAFVMFASQDWGDTANALSPPSGSTPTFTTRLNENGTGILFVADGVLAAAGATGNKSITNNSANSTASPWTGYLIKVESASGGGTFSKLLAESLSLSVKLSRSSLHPKAETISLAGFLKQHLTRRLLDVVSALEASGRNARKHLGDRVGTVEKARLGIARKLSEIVSFGDDAFRATRDLFLRLADACAISVAFRAIKSKLLALADSISFSYRLNRRAYRKISEALGLSGVLRRRSIRTLYESVSLSSVIVNTLAKLLRLLDVVAVKESVRRGVARRANELLAITGRLSRHSGRHLSEALAVAGRLASHFGAVADALRVFVAESWQRIWNAESWIRQWIAGEYMIYGKKAPDAEEDFQIQWAGVVESDLIAGSTWNVPSDITLVTHSFTDTTATARLSGGTLGKQYVVENVVTLQSGQNKPQYLTLSIQR